ncbi:MAG: hypothetical protein AAGH19_03765 [Pseudomonadota bacterium]
MTLAPAPAVSLDLKSWLGAVLAAAPCLYLSWVLLGVWAEPMARDEGRWVRFGVGLLILEFVLLHSGVFMTAALKKSHTLIRRVGFIAGLLCFYGLMVWAFAESTDSPALLWIFGAVVAGRVLTAFTNGPKSEEAMMRRSAIGVMCYLAVVFGTVFIPIPAWGITPEEVDQLFPTRGGGLWEAQPDRAVAGAAVYFGLMAVLELTVLRQSGKEGAFSV